MVFSPFVLLIWCFTLINIQTFEPSLDSRNKSYLVVMYNLFTLLFQFASYIVKDFYINIHNKYWPVRKWSFIVVSLALVSVMLATKNELGSIPSCFNFGGVWEELILVL